MWRKKRFWLLCLALVSFVFWACTASGEADESDVLIPSDMGELSSSVSVSSSSKDSSDADTNAFDLFDWVRIPKSSISRGINDFGVSVYSIATTEVTQKIYKLVMNELPPQSNEGDDRAVSNVSWFRAVLFCNAFSKLAGLDTAYIYKSIADGFVLVDLSIDYSAVAVRLPTENEWEIAARGGTTTTYYWDVDVAAKYAYYGQTSGPDVVAQKLPNEFGLYDMAGNVAEWVNDWYDAYPGDKSDNYTGPESGTYRIVRGGGWADKVSAIAPKEREKLAPVDAKMTLGFRLVYSTGF